MLYYASALLLQLLAEAWAKSSGSDWSLGLLTYGQKWRDYRRALWQHFHPGAIVKYRPAQESIVPLFLKKLLDTPDAYTDHVQL